MVVIRIAFKNLGLFVQEALPLQKIFVQKCVEMEEISILTRMNAMITIQLAETDVLLIAP